MAPGGDVVSKAIYRSVLQYARRFDSNMAAKALIQRYGAVRPPLHEFDAVRGDRRLYAAGLEVVVGTQCHVRPERLTWSLQRLVRNLRRADDNNLETVADMAAESEEKGGDGLPLLERHTWEQDAMAAISLEHFFPGALRGVDGADKVSAGFAALRELSSKWDLARSLGLVESATAAPSRWRKKRLAVRPRHKMTKKELRALRHQARRSEKATATASAMAMGYPGRVSSPSSPSSPSPESRLSVGSVRILPTDVPAKGVFLISHPLAGLHSPGDVFHRSVVLMVHHDRGGSYGLVVNKAKGETLREAMSSEDAAAVPLASEALRRVLGNPVRSGGPVMSRLAWLHHHAEVGGVPLSEDSENPVFFCGTMEKASELLGEGAAEPQDFSLVVGASTWAGGQLRSELDRGLWIMAKAPASLALDGGENLWREMLEAMGGAYAEMGRIPDGHRWAELGAKSSPSDWA